MEAFLFLRPLCVFDVQPSKEYYCTCCTNAANPIAKQPKKSVVSKIFPVIGQCLLTDHSHLAYEDTKDLLLFSLLRQTAREKPSRGNDVGHRVAVSRLQI